MKKKLIFLLVVLISKISIAQFSDTSQLNQYIRETIRDRRPEKVTAENIQRALLGITSFINTGGYAQNLQQISDFGYKTTNRIVAAGFGGPDSTSRTRFYIGDTLPAGGLGWKFQYSNGTYTAIGGRNPVGPTVYGMWAGKMSLQNNVSNTILGSGAGMDLTQEGNTLIGQVAARRAKTIWRNTVIGNGAMQFAWTGDFNCYIGVFAGETSSGSTGNTGVGANVFRAIRGGINNSSLGGSSSVAMQTVLDTILISSPGSGYSTNDTVMTISSPEYDPATGVLISTPGVGQVQATAIATITDGSVTAVRITNRGKGYSTEKAPVTASLTGSGSGAVFSVRLSHSEENTTIGSASFFSFINGKRNATLGANTGMKLTFGNDNIFVGPNSGNVVGQRDTINNSMAIGANTYTTASNQIVVGNDKHDDLRLYGVTPGAGVRSLRYDPSLRRVFYADTTDALYSNYTPTIIFGDSLTSATVSTCYYSRTGNDIRVWGTITIQPSGSPALPFVARVLLSIPIPSTITEESILSGRGACENGSSIAIFGDHSTNKAVLKFTPYSLSSSKYTFEFTYRYVEP